MSPEQVKGQGARRSPRRSLGARLHDVRVPHRPHGVVDRAGRRDDVRANRQRSAAQRARLSARSCPPAFKRGLPKRSRAPRTSAFRPRKSWPTSLAIALDRAPRATSSRSPHSRTRRRRACACATATIRSRASIRPQAGGMRSRRAAAAHEHDLSRGATHPRLASAHPSYGDPGGSPLSSTVDPRSAPKAKRAGRATLTLLGVAAITAGGYFGWLFLIRPAVPPVTTASLPSPSAARERPCRAPPGRMRPRAERSWRNGRSWSRARRRKSRRAPCPTQSRR